MGAKQSQLPAENVNGKNVGFFINGKEYNVKTDEDQIEPQSLLVDFIRDKAGLKGTKYMCREGGCGACLVAVKSRDPNTGSEVIRAVNSCLIPVLSADGWEITTVEGLGNKKDGYHQIQQRIVKFSGTQCGFCTPGMVMNMYSLSQAKPGFKSQDVEDSFDGNMCRCTGYRPILDAFKSLASDAPEELKRKCTHLDDCESCPIRTNSSKGPNSKVDDIEDFDRCCGTSQFYLRLKSGEEWVKATSLVNAFQALEKFTAAGMKYRIVGGNTGTGPFKEDGPYQAYIDINGIPELKHMKMDATGLEIGAAATLVDFIEFLRKASELDGYSYTAQMSKHIKRVANVPVRNAGTIAGNLMLKHAHREFPSDIFMLLESTGASLKIGFSPTLSKNYNMLEFRELDMHGKLILSIILPAYKGGNYYYRRFKITRRYQNAHAYVNGGILMRVDPSFTIMEKPRIVFGGINPDFVHASATEEFLNGKTLDSNTIKGAMEALEKEIQPNVSPPDAAPEYRKTLAQALLYKTILGVLGDTVRSTHKTGGEDLEHGPTSGTQTYATDKKDWPLYQPISKLEAVVQASGEAEYINDIHPEFGELFGAFVVTTVAKATLKNIDPSKALMIPGVVSFIQAKDIPGVNNYAVVYPQPEEIFIKEKVSHAGQSVGLILAKTKEAAFEAAKKVEITYDNIQTPVITLQDALKLAEANGEMEKCILEIRKSPTEPVAATQTIKGEFGIGSQYHMSMETQACICIPREDGMDVYSSTQYMDNIHLGISACLGIPNHNINIKVRRLGGGYGAKITKAAHIACACAVAAHVTNRPVRVYMDLETNMKMIGKRLPYLTRYEAGFDETGYILSLKASMFCDPGCGPNEETSLLALHRLQSCYRANGWEIVRGRALTNTPINTFCRAPGSPQAIATIEAIMDHIAHVLKKDPVEVRLRNSIQPGDPILATPGEKFEGENPIPKLIEELKVSADYVTRKNFIESFNLANRFRKRGMHLMPMRYPQSYPNWNIRLPVFISVFHGDGSVAVSHGGIEMGQGINTKCAQTVAHFLNIPLEKIKIKPSNNLISPDAMFTGSAIGSELVCHAAIGACKKLLQKMEPAKAKMKDPTWEKIVAECYNQNILMTAQHQDVPKDLVPYDIWGVCLTEVDVDVLTGEYKIVRVDLMQDAGLSLSPDVDIGQIEGAFVMGLGMWTTEKIIFDKSTGELLTKNTWEYKTPFTKDIPEDFRVTMLKNRPNPLGVLGSKATGEAPLCLSSSVLFAIKNAIDSARKDAGNTDWYQIDGPITPEDIQRLALTSIAQFDL